MRVTVPIAGSVRVLNTGVGVKGFSIQNVGAVDIYFSDDQRLLDSVDPTNLPTVGHLLAAKNPPSDPTVYPRFYGSIFARSQAAGAQLEVMVYEVEKTC